MLKQLKAGQYIRDNGFQVLDKSREGQKSQETEITKNKTKQNKKLETFQFSQVNSGNSNEGGEK